MVGSPAKTISGSSMLIEGKGWKVAGRDPPGSTMLGGSMIIGGDGPIILGGS